MPKIVAAKGAKKVQKCIADTKPQIIDHPCASKSQQKHTTNGGICWKTFQQCC